MSVRHSLVFVAQGRDVEERKYAADDKKATATVRTRIVADCPTDCERDIAEGYFDVMQNREIETIAAIVARTCCSMTR
ncbi:hypothetical protein [Bradyrhizobium sp. LHD-71]|uniref:hypothetical protein n=1 Tax=Bradyrhizobium sp. LHD-71 TaxID=3072141 RepID=UPI00280D6349|nr:hypothetical protein [Bradyrhizobium sp. LHD-71]MDQ8727566.1 hypothetical protein [Bradyrhizobium sp. LHD-71]